MSRTTGSMTAAVPATKLDSSRRRALGILRNLAAGLGVCAAIAAVLTGIFTPFVEGPTNLVITFVFNLVVSVSMWACCAAAFHLAMPPILERDPHPLLIAGAFAVILVSGVALGTEVALRAANLIWTNVSGPDRAGLFQVALIVSLIISLASQAYDGVQNRASRAELALARGQEQATRARLDALRARTNPHFLFNSLNTVASLVPEDPRQAERALETMAELYRYVLDGTRADRVPFERELTAVDAYLAMERLRFEDRLEVVRDVAPDVVSALVPPLVLQPLVENAVLHGIASRREGGTLRISATREGDELVLIVEDDGAGTSQHHGSGTAQADLGERLALAYGDRASLSIDTAPGTGYLVTVRLPFEGAGERESAS